jgi:hypothetical protein
MENTEKEQMAVQKFWDKISLKLSAEQVYEFLPLFEQAKQMEHENLSYTQAKSYNRGFFDGKNNEKNGGNNE